MSKSALNCQIATGLKERLDQHKLDTGRPIAHIVTEGLESVLPKPATKRKKAKTNE